MVEPIFVHFIQISSYQGAGFLKNDAFLIGKAIEKIYFSGILELFIDDSLD